MGKINDLTGEKFGMLTVNHRGADRYGKSGRKFITWVCTCDCGNIVTVDANNLRTGNSKSCGCDKKIKDMTNMRFGKLLVLEQAGRDKSGSVMWKCKCDCGKYTIVEGCNLRSGVTKSCGCGVINGLKAGWGASKTHGQTKTRLYNIWCGIKNRTSDKADKRHRKDYFERGIRMCEEWSTSFESFRDWSISHGYKDGLTIDRIDNNGNYEPSNCRWVTPAEQANNTRRNRNYTFNGETLNIQQWSRKLNVSEDMLRGRLVVLGWSVEDALLTPSKTRGWSDEQRQFSRLCGDMRAR